jgi:hypothetical protein
MPLTGLAAFDRATSNAEPAWCRHRRRDRKFLFGL